MMPDCRSRKRRRSRLEMGFAGCVLLANPVQGAWPLVGTVWSSLLRHRHTTPQHPHPTSVQREQQEPLQRAHHHYYHGTQEQPPRRPPHSLRGSTTTSPPWRAPAASASASGGGTTLLITRVLQAPAGDDGGDLHEVEVALHAGVGGWGDCSPETCTQTRQVVCQTRDSKIVASHLCGDELPASERACLGDDLAAVCGDTKAAATAAVVGVDGGGRDNDSDKDRDSAAGGRSASTPAAFPSTAVSGSGSGGAGEASTRAKVSARPSPTTASGYNNGSGGGGTGHDQRGSRPAATDGEKRKPRMNIPAPVRPPTKKAAAAALEEKDDAEAPDLGMGVGGDKEEEESGAEESASTKSASSRKQGETSSIASPKSTEPNLAAGGQQISQMGGLGGSRAHRLEYRFWLVLAIGAGAVGSFMAVVVFAVGQYRKDQHRLRGIMALNEFPQDNYINPFAKQLSSDLSEDDRSAFKL